ncbi:hypothetical protein HYPSUDRAFT_199300 [Hypholoma sublateritium FD-334 SS-4]|uniref:Uncharacterized protein n=1 Tax=Hypholoma sublateritium (strain FD-334 SS-4) TaxID=945553 RepID=A0A0D2LEV6_HYPSF|nr:hypothetical protein HYPSUDRAFT_199300 [Hypholoma sublateritium FD-334 SS-4]
MPNAGPSEDVAPRRAAQPGVLAGHLVKLATALSAVVLPPASARSGHNRTSSDATSRNASPIAATAARPKTVARRTHPSALTGTVVATVKNPAPVQGLSSMHALALGSVALPSRGLTRGRAGSPSAVALSRGLTSTRITLIDHSGLLFSKLWIKRRGALPLPPVPKGYPMIGNIYDIPHHYLIHTGWIPGAGFKRNAEIWATMACDLRDVPFNAVKNSMDEGTAQRSFAYDN